MKKNYWQLADWYGTWNFVKFLDKLSLMRLSEASILLKDLLKSINKYFKPTAIDISYYPIESIGKNLDRKITVDKFEIKSSESLNKILNDYMTKNFMIINLIYVYGKTSLYVYNERGKIVKKWVSSGDRDDHDYLTLDVHCHPNYPKPHVTITLDTSSDIWLSRVSTVNENTFQHYDNSELAKLNSKTLSAILKSIKKTFKPDEIETWSEIDQEGCEKNLPNKLVTETGFNQDRIKEIWGN